MVVKLVLIKKVVPINITILKEYKQETCIIWKLTKYIGEIAYRSISLPCFLKNYTSLPVTKTCLAKS